MNWIDVEDILLPSPDKTVIFRCHNDYLQYDPLTSHGYAQKYVENLHIYIIDRKAQINEKDWYWKPDMNAVFRAEYIPYKGCCKIVATTDPILIADGVAPMGGEFMTEYTRYHGERGRKMLKMEMSYSCMLGYFTDDCTQNGKCDCKENRQRPKLDHDGNVVLRVEDRRNNIDLQKQSHVRKINEVEIVQSTQIKCATKEEREAIMDLCRKAGLVQHGKTGIYIAEPNIHIAPLSNEWFTIDERETDDKQVLASEFLIPREIVEVEGLVPVMTAEQWLRNRGIENVKVGGRDLSEILIEYAKYIKA